MYGLHLIPLTQAQRKRINAFHLKGLRRILNLKTTYIDRTNTNQRVYDLSNKAIRRDHQDKQRQRKKNHPNPETFKPAPLTTKPVGPISLELDDLAITYIGHLLREEGTFTREVSYRADASYNLHPKARVGGERLSWIKHYTTIYWSLAIPKAMRLEVRAAQFAQVPYDATDASHRNFLKHCAGCRFR